jgi:hypothetical protein
MLQNASQQSDWNNDIIWVLPDSRVQIKIQSEKIPSPAIYQLLEIEPHRSVIYLTIAEL